MALNAKTMSAKRRRVTPIISTTLALVILEANAPVGPSVHREAPKLPARMSRALMQFANCDGREVPASGRDHSERDP